MNIIYTLFLIVCTWSFVGEGFIDTNTGAILTMLSLIIQWLAAIHEKLCRLLGNKHE